MKKLSIKRIILIATLTAASTLLVNSAWAAEQPTQKEAKEKLEGDVAYALSNSITQSFKSLRKEIKTLFQAGFQFAYQEDYQQDPNTIYIRENNSKTPGKMSHLQTEQRTQTVINGALNQLNFTPTKSKIGKKYLTFLNDNGLTALSGVKAYNTTNKKPSPYTASDSLYLAANNTSATLAKINQKPYVETPTSFNDSMLNFTSLITPTAYKNMNTFKDAKNFVKYVTQDTINWFDMTEYKTRTGIKIPKNIPGLYGATLNFKPIITSKNEANSLYKLKTDPVYQRFIFNLRTMLAQRSVSTNILSHLVSERTPTDLSYIDNNGKKVKNVSPLQLESYIANHRVQNPKWYTDIQNASPALIQRKTLIVLAEIERQNYQAHLDRERLLAAIATLTLNFQQQTLSGYIAKEENAINTAIKKAAGQKTAPK